MSELFEKTQEPRWYIVQTYSQYENKVKANLEQRKNLAKDRIFDVLVPVEEKTTIKDGKSRTVKKKIFPGYVLVNMIMEEQSWYIVRHTPGVMGFVGAGNHPIPLAPKEIAAITREGAESEAKPKVEMDVAVGDTVRVKAGAFAGNSGPVVEIDADKAKVKFRVVVFGRETDVEADYGELEKI